MCIGGKKSAAPVTNNYYTEPPAEETTTTDEPTSDLTDANQRQKITSLNAQTGETSTTFGSELGA